MALVNTLPLLFDRPLHLRHHRGELHAPRTPTSPTSRRRKSAPRASACSARRSASASSSGPRSAASSARSICACRSGPRPALALTNFCYGFFVLPESLPPERRTPRFDWSARQSARLADAAAPLSAGVRPGRGGVPADEPRALRVYPSMFVLYADYRYGWGPQQVGYTLALVGVCSAIVQAWLVGKLVPRIGERRTLLLGSRAAARSASRCMALRRACRWCSWSACRCCALGHRGPATQAMMTRQVDPPSRAACRARCRALSSLAGIFGPAMFTQSSRSSSAITRRVHLPGAPFLLSSALLVGGVAARVERHGSLSRTLRTRRRAARRSCRKRCRSAKSRRRRSRATRSACDAKR